MYCDLLPTMEDNWTMKRLIASNKCRPVVFHIGFQALDIGRDTGCSLSRVESLKLVPLHVLGELHAQIFCKKIDKGIANIAIVAEVDGYIQEVVCAPEAFFVELFNELAVGVPIWDIPQHDGCDSSHGFLCGLREEVSATRYILLVRRDVNLAFLCILHCNDTVPAFAVALTNIYNQIASLLAFATAIPVGVTILLLRLLSIVVELWCITLPISFC